jgi:citrate lyase subunit beta/citryl-CoA lyase
MTRVMICGSRRAEDIQLLIETAKGVINAYPSAIASKRVNSLIFGAVDYTKDMRVKLTSEGEEQRYARRHTAVAARAAGCVPKSNRVTLP